MVARGSGVMIFTGAMAGVNPGARSVAFGPGNFAKRGLAQSLARDLGPKGVYVAVLGCAFCPPRGYRVSPLSQTPSLIYPKAIPGRTQFTQKRKSHLPRLLPKAANFAPLPQVSRRSVKV
jgi:NAD(P)-dependent dehydrogenase (short-subunit alcohol dehydrogenase family)